jgi:hypothetical protein
MKLDNVAQITTSEIQVKAREGVPRGTGEESRRAGEWGREGAYSFSDQMPKFFISFDEVDLNNYRERESQRK